MILDSTSTLMTFKSGVAIRPFIKRLEPFKIEANYNIP